MELRCPACDHEIAFANINVAAVLAKCGACGEVFRPSARLSDPEATVEDPAPDIPLERRAKTERMGSRMKWHTPSRLDRLDPEWSTGTPPKRGG